MSITTYRLPASALKCRKEMVFLINRKLWALGQEPVGAREKTVWKRRQSKLWDWFDRVRPLTSF